MNGSNRPLRRSRSDSMVAGVVGGLARYAGMDPSLARVIFVVVSLLSAAFPGLLVYVILWIVMPKDTYPEVSSGFVPDLDS